MSIAIGPKGDFQRTPKPTAARRSLGVPDEMDYEEMSEPNMKLSRALLIVLVLHVVAISGMVAFNVIKSRQGELPSVATAKTVAPASTQKSPVPAVADSDSSKPTGPTSKDEATNCTPVQANKDVERLGPSFF